MHSKDLIIGHEAGVHTRIASVFVRAASKFISAVQLENLLTGRQADGKSIALILSLGMQYKTPVRIYAEGADEEQAVNILAPLLEGTADLR